MREADKAHAGRRAGTPAQHLADPRPPVDGRRRAAAAAATRATLARVRSRRSAAAGGLGAAEPAGDREHAHAAGSRRGHAAAGRAGQRVQSRLGHLQSAGRPAGDGHDECAEHTDVARGLCAR